MNIEQLIKQLPSRWEDITLRQFQLLMTCEIDETNNPLQGIENTLQMVNKLTGTSIDELEELSMMDITKIGEKMSFITKLPEGKTNAKIKWKKLEEITFNDFIIFNQLQEKQLENLHILIKNFSHTELSEEEILDLPITDVIVFFYLLRKVLQQSLMHSIRLTSCKIIKQITVKKLKGLKRIISKVKC